MNTRQRMFARLVIGLVVLVAAGAAGAQTMTLADAQAIFPQYTMQQQTPGAFQTPCVDANGTMTIVADVGDITQDAIGAGMVCQAVGYPPFQAGGTITFDVSGAFLLSLAQAPGFPDAFALDFAIPLGTQTITITITDTGWPEGCIDPGIFVDFAGFEDLTVPAQQVSWGTLRARHR